MRTGLRKFGLGIAAAILAVAGFTVATASPAAAAAASPAVAAVTCGPSAPDYDGGTAQAVNPVSGYSGPAMRTGPGTNCQLLTRVPWYNWVSLNCYRFGDTVNGVSTWSAVHYGGYFGWVSDYYLSGRGSNYAC